MPGTKAGGAKAAETNKRIHGSDFYAKIGRKGGRNGVSGGFASKSVGKDGLTGAERARIAGRKGGSISRRGPSKNSSRIKNEREIAEYAKKYGNQEDWSEYAAKK